MNDAVKVAVISGVFAIITTLISTAAVVLPLARGTAEEVAQASFARNVTGIETIKGDHHSTFEYDLSPYEGDIAIITTSTLGRIDRDGGGKASVVTTIEIFDQVASRYNLISRDIDLRTGRNLDNEDFGASASYAFIVTKDRHRVKSEAWATADNKKPMLTPTLSCLILPAPSGQD